MRKQPSCPSFFVVRPRFSSYYRPFDKAFAAGVLAEAVRFELTRGVNPCRFSIHTSAFAAGHTWHIPWYIRSWAGSCLRHSNSALGGNRLISTPSPIGAWLGVASAACAARGFAEFDSFHPSGFPGWGSCHTRPVQSTALPRLRGRHFSGNSR
jgi:hypothetical protein